MAVASALGFHVTSMEGETVGLASSTDDDDYIASSSSSTAPSTPVVHIPKAEAVLFFHSVFIASYQVELLFVFCTLLSGRRRFDMQNMLTDLKLPRVLRTMFDRIEWGGVTSSPVTDSSGTANSSNSSSTASSSGRGGQRSADALDELEESEEGNETFPSCHDSAVRVQFLRVIYNYMERDCRNNEMKLELLSPLERAYFESSTDAVRVSGADITSYSALNRRKEVRVKLGCV